MERDDRVCVIFGAMDPGSVWIPKGAFVMACDAGFAHLGSITPDLLVGDFDSLGHIPDGYPVLFHPPEKDDTDVMLAVKRGFELGYRRFILYGCMGGRVDHAFGSYQALGYIVSHGGDGWMAGEGWLVTVRMPGRLVLAGRPGQTFSVFAFGGEAVVSIENAKYTVHQADFTPFFPLGVSNEFVGGDAAITVHSGSVLVMAMGEPPLLESII